MGQSIAKAIVAGLPLAIVAAMLGSFIQWRKMAFFGDALAHSALLGIGLSLMFGLNHMVGIVFVLVLIALYLHSTGDSKLPADTRLSVSAHLSLAGGSLAIYLSGSRINWEAILFGNILALTWAEVATLLVVLAAIATIYFFLWSKLVLMSVNSEIAGVEIARAKLVNITFLLLLCAFVAVGVSLVGVLLLNALLIIPTAAASLVTKSPAMMIIAGAVLGSLCVLLGIGMTFTIDVPVGPVSILLAGLAYGACWVIYAMPSKSS